MAQYLLRAGIHQGADRTKKPIIKRDAQGNVVDERWPTRTYRAGETVESDVDLVRLHGEKFAYPTAAQARTVPDIDRQIAELEQRRAQLVEAEARAKAGAAGAAEASPTTLNPFPHGQVLEGFQGTVAGISGMIDPKLNAEMQQKHGVGPAAQGQSHGQEPGAAQGHGAGDGGKVRDEAKGEEPKVHTRQGTFTAETAKGHERGHGTTKAR